MPAFLEVLPAHLLRNRVDDDPQLLLSEVVAPDVDLLQGIGNLQIQTDFASTHRAQQVGFDVQHL